MSFDRPIRLFREGFGNIVYGNKPGASGGFINIAGARNGLSIDAANNVVLGQDATSGTNPAILLNNRAIPMGTFQFNLFGGSTVFSDVKQLGAGGLVEMTETVAAASARATLHISPTWTGSAVPVGLLLQAVRAGGAGTGRLFNFTMNGNSVLSGSENGIINAGDPILGIGYAAIAPANIFGGGLSAVGSSLIGTDGFFGPTSGSGQFSSFIDSTVVQPAGGTIDFCSYFSNPPITQSGGTGLIRGFYFQPNIATVTSRMIAYENVEGDNLLNSTSVSGRDPGRTGIYLTRNPTARLHIGPGTIAVPPLKLTNGPFTTAASTGQIEYNGVNLAFTRQGVTRETVFTGLSGAAAPAITTVVLPTGVYGSGAVVLSTPPSWASVVIAGTTFKIPLYT